MPRAKQTAGTDEKEPARKYSPRRLRYMARALDLASQRLEAIAAAMEAGGISFAFYKLSHTENTLIKQSLRYTRDAKSLLDDEFEAKRSGTLSDRTKSVMKYRTGEEVDMTIPSDLDLDEKEAELDRMEKEFAATRPLTEKPKRKGVS